MNTRALILMMLAVGCDSQNKRNISHPEVIVEPSIGFWRTNLGGEQRDVGLNIAYEPTRVRVSEEFVNFIAERATLVNAQGQLSSPPELSRMMEQGEVPSLQPAELVLNASAATTGGWNQLNLSFSEPVTCNEMKVSTVAIPFRIESAPIVVGLRFDTSELSTRTDLTVEFSEIVAAEENAQPLSVKVNGLDVTCALSWSSSKQHAYLRNCSSPLQSSVTVKLIPGLLHANGHEVTDIDGNPFEVTLNPAELPLDINNRRRWAPALPH